MNQTTSEINETLDWNDNHYHNESRENQKEEKEEAKSSSATIGPVRTWLGEIN